jgi:hypothetical protein
MILVGCGDSWCWGSELVDPEVELTPIGTIHKDTHQLHFKPENLKWRETHRYLNLFKNKIKADSVVDLSLPGISNEKILRTLVTWLAENGYTTGRDTSELFISIGWTSPERREFLFYEPRDETDNQGWLDFGPWYKDRKISDRIISKFFDLYAAYFHSQRECLLRWFLQVYQTECMLKSLNIKYLMHQAIYDNFHYRKSEDDSWRKSAMSSVPKEDLAIWDSIDESRFFNKNHNTRGSLYALVEKYGPPDSMLTYHPSHIGHKFIADNLYQFCKVNNIL